MFSHIALWMVVFLILILTLRVIRWLQSMKEAQLLEAHKRMQPELQIGRLAPTFAVPDLSGRYVRPEDYRGVEVAFVFVSPNCGICRRELGTYTSLGEAGRSEVDAALVLVSDETLASTRAWISTVQQEDGLRVSLPVLVPERASMLTLYNPRGVSPYFVQLDPDGLVVARDTLDTEAWLTLQGRWRNRPVTAPRQRPTRRYQ